MSRRAFVARARPWLVSGGLLAAIALLVQTVHRHQPIQHWLFIRYAGYATLTALWSAACVASGHAGLRALLGRVLPVREQLVLSFPTGVLIYFWLAFVGGLLGLIGPAFFVLAPSLMLAVGARPSIRYGRRLARHLAHARRKGAGTRSSLASLAPLYGVICLALIYFSILSPLNASWDARWYHLPLAEQYAATGRIGRFPEGWVFGTYPHLASVVYAWGFMLPVGQLFDRIALCAHLEYCALLWTVAALPVLARRLLPRGRRTRLPHAWVAMFLFPGLFLYDSSLNMSADHVAALWAAPIYLALLYAWPRLGVRECCLLSVFLSGALLTKYTAIIIAAPAIVAVVVRALFLLSRRSRAPRMATPLRGALASLFVGLVLTSPHWAKNWLWYGDPLYPHLERVLLPRPWLPEVSLPFHTDIAVSWHVGHDLHGLLESLRTMFTFAFVHHDWPDLHGQNPLFGFLFTLSLFVLPFLGKAPRLWGLYACAHAGVALWTQISLQDRYLQVLVPWMAAGVAAVIAELWRNGAAARGLTALLLLLQVVWGADAYFYKVHRMIKDTPAVLSIDLLNTGRLQKVDTRFEIFEPNRSIADALPKDAVVLAHGTRQTLGLGRRLIHDSPGTQGGIVYSRLKSPREVYELLRGMGVTHLVWDQTSETADTIASDYVFFDFAMRYTEDRRDFGTRRVARMPDEPAPDTPFPRTVAYLACLGRYQPGLYAMSALTVPVCVPPYSPERLQEYVEAPSSADAMIARADAVVLQPNCRRGATSEALADFELIARRGVAELYVRKTP